MCVLFFVPSATSASFMALTGNFAATAEATPSVSLRSTAPPRGRLMALPETLPPPPKAVPLGKVDCRVAARRKGYSRASGFALEQEPFPSCQRLPLRGSWQNRQVLTEGVRSSALLQKIAFSANLCLTTDRLSDIIEHVPAVRCRTNLSDHGPVAQLVRAPACHAGGRRFEPDPGRHLLL